MEVALIENRLVRLVRRSDFGLGRNTNLIRASTHVTQVLGTRLGLSASIGQATTLYQVMTRGQESNPDRQGHDR